jgi:hypothetical protein
MDEKDFGYWLLREHGKKRPGGRKTRRRQRTRHASAVYFEPLGLWPQQSMHLPSAVGMITSNKTEVIGIPRRLTEPKARGY